MKVCKYTTYSELAEAFKSGELDPDKHRLILDNDSSFLVYCGDDEDEGDAFDAANERQAWFTGNGKYDLPDVLEALGIPNEPC